MATPLNLSIASPRYGVSSSPLLPQRNLNLRPTISTLSNSHGDSSSIGFSSRTSRLPLKLDGSDVCSRPRNGVIEAKTENPPIMPAVRTPAGPLDLSTILFRNRVIFIGQPISSDVAQRVISQLMTLAAIDEESDIMIYMNSPGGNVYSVLAIYDCMSWIKPRVGAVAYGMVASQSSILLAGAQKGMRYAMPNTRIMIHQPHAGCGGHVEDVKRQINEAVHSRHKIDKMYVAFTGQTHEIVQLYTDRDFYFCPHEAMEFGLIDGVLETEY